MQPTRTKIVATVGPASSSPEAIAALIAAGVDVFRLNFSHGTRETHGRAIEVIRTAAERAGQPVGILQDLQGPRIRTGLLRGHEPVELRAGDEVVLRPGDFKGDARTIAVSYEGLARDLNPGDSVLLSDGLLELRVLEADEVRARCRVVLGGLLGERKGINLPGLFFNNSATTEKDLEDLRFGLERGVDYVALSFVESGDDVARLRREMTACGAPDVPVIAKIERPQGVENLEGILDVAGGVMVARGDLGIEIPAEAVPAVQKQIIRAANRRGRPVITATQMLESMISAPRPTRAEASDVANAILDGTDAVMLSGETSMGRYPVESVRMMERIACHTERLRRERPDAAPDFITTRHTEFALAGAACLIADQLGAAGIVPFTTSGATACFVSQRRPAAPIYALTPEPAVYNRMTLLWGVRPVMLERFDNTDEMVQRGEERLRELGLVSAGERVVYIAGARTNTPGGTDMLKIHRFE